ncbi:MAG: 4,5-DOPA dioxygenase extradiol [Acidimicrobiia bacterium]
MSATMPAAFLGHGSPMNALLDNRWTRTWNEFGRSIPTPRAVLSISAHWYTRGTGVTAMAMPPTIHDFGGFPQELFDYRYPAPGDPAFAKEVSELLDIPVSLDDRWGLDHGTWSVLCHVYPNADVPVVQLSIDATEPPSWHWDLARQLQPLRDDGVLIVGSGSITHNLSILKFGATRPEAWAAAFDDHVAAALRDGNKTALVDYAKHPSGRTSVPTPDHYLPMLSIAALRRDDEIVTTITDGFDAGTLSMRSFRVG